MNNGVFLENKNLNREETGEKKSALTSKVTSLVVTLTTRCNISCIMCEEKLIPWDIPQRTIQEVVALFPYLEQVIWQGGETLILDYFQDLLDEAAKHDNLYQTIITNGLPIDEKLARKLVKENMELTFSIDAVSKGLYESIRRQAKFEDLLKSIKMVNDFRKELNLKKMAFRMHVVVMKSNYRQLERFVDFAKENGFDSLHLMQIWGNLNSEENIFYHNDFEALNYIKENISNVERKAREYNLNLLNSLAFADNSGRESVSSRSSDSALFCYMPWKRMVINPAGNVCPACHCREMVGNVSEHSLEDIWNSEKMQEYRRKLSNGDYSDLCSDNCVKKIISEELRGLR